MQYQDRYGNPLTTTSQAAVDAYVRGVDLFLEAQAGADKAFEDAIAADPNLAVAYADQARNFQMTNRMGDARESIEKAVELATSQSPREQGHVAVLHNLLSGNGPAAYAGILAHMKDYPRDVMVIQPCAGVFGLIGFSGRSGREAELLAFQKMLEPHYSGDWWFETQLAFAEAEAGQTAEAQKRIAPAFAANRRNANAAHINAHIQYEAGEVDAGYDDIVAWRKSYDPNGFLHCHVSWHEAIWALETGNVDHAWSVIDADVRPNVKWGPTINVLTDTAAFLLRAEFAGVPRQPDRWKEVSAYASTYFAKPGISFADAHAVIAHGVDDLPAE